MQLTKMNYFKNHFHWQDNDLKCELNLKNIPFVIFDTEIFHNYFCVVFMDSEGIKSFDSTQVDEIQEYISSSYRMFVGFNNHRFDNLVMQELFNNGVSHLKEYVNLLISQEWTKPERRLLNKPTLDVLTLLTIDETGGLKGQALRRNAYRLQDLPYPHDAVLTEEQKEHVLYYCVNDVVETHHVLKRKMQDAQIRLDLAQLYSLDRDTTLEVLSSKGARVAEIVLKELYMRAEHLRYLGKAPNKDYSIIYVKDLIPTIEFKTDVFKKHYENLMNMRTYPGTFDQDLKATLVLQEAPDLTFEFGSGGLHAALSNVQLATNDTHVLEDRDVTSYYPNLMLTRKIYPSHFLPSFLDEFKGIVDQRIEAKRSGDKKKSEALKLVINSTFGKLNDKYSPFYDVSAMLKVTLAGQLYLMQLCEDYILAGHTVVAANTDGILLYYSKAADVKAIDCAWQQATNMELEYAPVQKLYQKDVNNYIAVGSDSKIKAKGRFVPGSANLPEIVAEAVQAWVAYGTPFQDTLRANTAFEKLLHKVSIRKPWVAHYNGQPQGKSLRFYEAIDGAQIIKHNPAGKQIKLAGADSVKIIDEFTNEIPEDINLAAYVKMCETLAHGKQKAPPKRKLKKLDLEQKIAV